ncbi:MAG TPA: PrsW family glutamic-type intramembrane protease [Stellaceae bacterium]|nr:PrsW family glutamic-type intramembrane protease [Stellaceae bacterium]
MLLLILLSGAAAPLASCELVAWLLRLRHRWRVYRVPFGIGLVVAVILVTAETRLDPSLMAIGGTPQRALALAFLLGALPEELLKLLGFLVWLWAGGGGDPRHRLVGAVAVAMGFDMIETWLQLWQWADRPELWLAMLAQRALLAAPMSAVGGFVVGVWSAATPEARGGTFARNLGIGWLAAVLAHGVWDGSVFVALGRLGAQDAAGAAAAAVPGLLGAAAIGGSAIVVGLRRAGGMRRLREGETDDRS